MADVEHCIGLNRVGASLVLHHTKNEHDINLRRLIIIWKGIIWINKAERETPNTFLESKNRNWSINNYFVAWRNVSLNFFYEWEGLNIHEVELFVQNIFKTLKFEPLWTKKLAHLWVVSSWPSTGICCPWTAHPVAHTTHEQEKIDISYYQVETWWLSEP